MNARIQKYINDIKKRNQKRIAESKYMNIDPTCECEHELEKINELSSRDIAYNAGFPMQVREIEMYRCKKCGKYIQDVKISNIETIK